MKITDGKFGYCKILQYLCRVIKNVFDMEKRILTDREWELIEAIRNFKNSQHNYSFQFELYLRELFEQVLREED
jgi:hypothetical protein